jgi:hypothetical protein
MTAFAGFDSSAYPGDPIMEWLRTNTNLAWCGYYFGKTPSHTGTDWMGKRTFLQGLNWGIAPLYVGQELIGPGSHHTNGIQGTIDGKDAAQFMSSEGFASGSVVYLDLENGLPFPDAQKAYVRNWCASVQQAGLTPGVYCSHTFAAQVATLVPAAMVWAFNVPTTDPNKVPGPHYPDPSPAGSGYIGAFIWQLGQHCLIDVPGAPGGVLEVDLDSASTPNPTIPRTNFALNPAKDDLWAANLVPAGAPGAAPSGAHARGRTGAARRPRRRKSS